MRRLLSVAAPAAAGLAALAATAVPAAATPTAVTGGRTTVEIPPATTSALLGAGIVPLPIAPGSERPTFRAGGIGVAASFPVTGGSVDLSALTGTITHAGGLALYDVRTGRDVTVDNFDIVLGSSPVLTAEVPALHARATIFDLSLAHAHITTSGARVTVTGVGVTLDPGAATVLDHALRTAAFTGGLPIGTATTSITAG